MQTSRGRKSGTIPRDTVATRYWSLCQIAVTTIARTRGRGIIVRVESGPGQIADSVLKRETTVS